MTPPSDRRRTPRSAEIARFLPITDEYYFRPVEPADERRLYALANEAATRPYFKRAWPITETNERRYIEQSSTDHTKQVFAIANTKNELVGVMSLHDIDQQSRKAETGAMLSAGVRNRGLGQQAKMVLLYHAFMVLNLRHITSRVIAFNERSYAYSQKCGYREVGRIPDHIYWDGRYFDEVTLLVCQADWQPLWTEYQAHNARPSFDDQLRADGQLRE